MKKFCFWVYFGEKGIYFSDIIFGEDVNTVEQLRTYLNQSSGFLSIRDHLIKLDKVTDIQVMLVY